MDLHKRRKSLRRCLRLVIESLVWYISLLSTLWLKFDGKISYDSIRKFLILGTLAAFSFIVCNYVTGVYKVRYRVASFEEIIKITWSIILTTLFLLLLEILLNISEVSLYTLILYGFFTFILQVSVRIFISKKLSLYFIRENKGTKTLIYGAGIIGQQIVEQMLNSSNKFDPVGFIDDDLQKANFVFLRRPVIGTFEDLSEIVKRHTVDVLVVAITELNSVKLLQLEQKCEELKILVKVVPSALEILKRESREIEISEYSVENILGRNKIDLTTNNFAEFFEGKKILITGAGGSIGSEIARQISHFKTSNLFLLDRDENALLSLSLSINSDGLFVNRDVILCDIRDYESLTNLLTRLKPDIVFHAAALKHLALLERFPEEAYKTNSVATQFLIDTCLRNNVEYFINISTDKAVEPSSTLGKSKLISERYISGIKLNDKKYISVRFGNVVGSNGSFLNTFRRQIDSGGPIMVTDPDVSRYFMTIQEAVYLVLQSVLVGECGETLVLDMGEPVKINDIAKKMIADSGKQIQIKYTGLRSGEKLHESLIGMDEKAHYGSHQNIRHIRAVPLGEES